MAPAGSVRAEVVSAYDRHMRGRNLESSVIATTCYLVTLVVVRIYTTLAHTQPAQADIVIGDTHIHHVVFGVLALLVSGVFSLDQVLRVPRSVLFGIGAALVLDEFALIVFLKDVYWLPQGWLSIVAVVIGLLAMAVNAWRGRAFVKDLAGIAQRRQAREGA